MLIIAILMIIGLIGFIIFIIAIFQNLKMGKKADLISKSLPLNDRLDYIILRQKILHHSIIISSVLTIILFIIGIIMSNFKFHLSQGLFLSLFQRFISFLIISYIILYETRLKRWLMKYKDYNQ
jgi:hypothetical protein